MAKQISLKNQIYQQIANQQVQQVMANQREQGIQQLQADFDAWQTRQNEIAQLQADFDAWKQQNAPQVQPQPRQTIPSIADVQPAAHEQTEMEKHIAEVTKQAKENRLRERAQKLQQLEQIEASQPHSKKERETLANIEDISKKLTNVVPETEALDTVTKTWRRGQRPEATDTSSQVAARVTNEKKPEIDTTNVPVNVDRWLSPDTKLTEAEKKKAKEYASAELQKIQYGPNKMPLFENEEQRQHYADMVNLINKTNGFTNFMSGAIEVPYNLADMVSDGARSVGNQLGGLGAAITDKLGITEGATQRHNEQAEIANQFADQNEVNMRQNFRNAQTQNPGAYTAGKIAGQTGMYMLTNPVFDGIAAGAGVESELAKFFINQGAQNVQDLVLDTAPTVRQLMEDGSTPEEVKREALNNILWNVAGNAVMGGLGAWAGNRAARNASDEAFRENVRAGADNLSRIANEQIPVMGDVDNVVRNATRQAEEAAQNIDNLSRQIQKTDTSANVDFNKFVDSNAPKVYVDPVDTALNDPSIVRTHTPKEIQNMREYASATDDNIVKLAEDVRKGNHIDPYEVKVVDERMADDLKKITGLDSEGRRLLLDRDSFRHIDDQHGVNGKENHSMADDNSLARIKYVLDNYDEALFPDPDDAFTKKISLSDNSPAPKAVFVKKIDGQYYVVTATSDSKKGKDFIVSAYIDSVDSLENNIKTGKLARVADAVEKQSSPLLTSDNGHEAAALEGFPSDSNITDAISEVNKNSVNSVARTTPELSTDTQEKIASDFEEIYRGMEDMRSIVESSNNAKVTEKYEKLQQAVFKYEELVYNSDSLEEINKAKKAADAARQGFIREAKKVDSNFKGSLTGTKLGNAEFRRTSTAPTDSAVLDEIVDDMVKQDMENPNRFVRDAKPDNVNVYRGVNSEVPKDYSIQEVNRKGGKKGYYVAESVGDGATKNVEPGKVYKTKKEAENALGNYKLQTFAGGDGPKENWKTSKFYTNTATKKGWSDNLDAKDYGFRATNAQEQESVFNNRYKDSKDIVRDLVELDSFDDADMRGAMNTMEKLMEGSTDDIRKASRLGKKISFEGREGGRVVQAIGEAKANTPAGQLREAQRTIGDAIDKRVGEGTSEALDNLYEKVMQSYEDSASKEEFSKKLEDLLTGDLKQHVSSKTAKKMQSKQIKGLNKIIKMIDNAESLDKVKIDDLMDVMYKLNGGVLLSPQTEKEVYELLKEASKFDPSSYEFRRLQAQAARKVMAEVPSGLGDYVRAFLYDNMLGNFKTAFSRNFIGNMAYQSLEKVRELPSAAVDKLVSLKTGKHSSLGWNKGKRKAYTEGFKTGGLETLKDIKSGVNTTRSGQTGWKETLSNNRTVHNDNSKIGHWANQVDFYVENAMKGGDRPIYEANYAEFKTELEQLLDRYGKDGVAGLEKVKDEDISDVIDKIAAVRAADAVFQKKGHMSEGLTKLRDGLGELSKGALGVDVLSTASTPFTLTPGNMLEKAVEYTPLGVVKNAVETAKELRGGGFNQRRFVEEAGRTITGLPVLLAAYAGAKNGIINGGLSEDQDEKQAQLDDGFIEYGLNVPEQVPIIGGKTLDTSDLPVYGPFAQAGAAMTEEGLTPNSMLQAGEAVLGGSATQGIRRAFGAENGMYSGQGGLLDNLKNTVMASGTQLVPSLVRQTAQTTDKYKRDLGEYGTNEYYLNSIKNSIPGLRQTLPIKTDVEGQPILQNQGRNLGSKVLENYILPMNMSEYKPSELNEEASRLLDATDKPWAFQPKALRKDLRQWDEKAGMKFTEKQFRMYKENLGKKNAQMGNALLESDYYKKLDDEAKVEAMQSVYSAMKALAKENATGIKSDDKIVAAYKKGKEQGVVNYLYGNSLIEEAGISKQSNAAKEAMKLAEQGKFSKAKKVIDDYAKYKEISDQYDVSDGTFIPSDTAQAIKDKIAAGDTTGARQLAKQQSELQSYGFGSDSGIAKYQKAKDVIPGLTTKQFATTYKGMDANGKSGISQTEFLDYVNSLDLTPEQAQQYLEAYGGWENKKGQQKKLVGSSGHYDLTY